MNRQVYSPQEHEVFNLLTITGRYKIVGSQTLPHLKFKSDFDLLEQFNTPDVGSYPKRILKIFQAKFKRALKEPNMFITDFKCGEDDKGEPLRWDKKSIQEGVLRGYRFEDQLLKKSVIKMDIIAFIDGVAIEFTNNFWFRLNGYQNYENKTTDQIYKEMLQDGREYLADGNVFKAMKRVFASLKLIDKGKETRDLMQTFFNSSVGYLNSVKNDIDTLKTLTETKFKKVPRDKVVKNLDLIQQKLESSPYPRLKTVGIDYLTAIKKAPIKKMPEMLGDVRDYLQCAINDFSHEFVENHPEIKKFF
mgnify:CR=1 FL=1